MKTQARKSRLERTILDNLNTAILLFDDGLRLTYVNPAGEMLFAVSARHVLGLRAGDMVPCLEHSVEDRFREALRTRHPFTEREINITVSDGSTITVNCRKNSN